MNGSVKINWQGQIQSIQPRTRVWRYLTDNRTHYLLGYNFFIIGQSDPLRERFTVAISEKQQMTGMFKIGDYVEGTAWTKQNPEREFADYYRAGSLKLLQRADGSNIKLPPPWVIQPPSLRTYEERGARMLSKSLWAAKCFTCVWANMANVEIQWDFDRNIKRYRFESFCYGPKSCKYYKMGRPRSVPYRNRGSSLDTGFLDELCTEGRGDDE